MSASPLRADMVSVGIDICKVPQADIDALAVLHLCCIDCRGFAPILPHERITRPSLSRRNGGVSMRIGLVEKPNYARFSI
jgi:hypothetical protein